MFQNNPNIIVILVFSLFVISGITKAECVNVNGGLWDIRRDIVTVDYTSDERETAVSIKYPKQIDGKDIYHVGISKGELTYFPLEKTTYPQSSYSYSTIFFDNTELEFWKITVIYGGPTSRDDNPERICSIRQEVLLKHNNSLKRTAKDAVP